MATDPEHPVLVHSSSASNPHFTTQNHAEHYSLPEPEMPEELNSQVIRRAAGGLETSSTKSKAAELG